MKNNYQEILKNTADWDAYLMEQSCLPGPRGNLELADAVIGLADEKQIRHFLSLDGPDIAENTPQVFVVFCGVEGLGKLLASGQNQHLAALRVYASDSRWRIREAVARALQRWGLVDMDALLDAMEGWGTGNPLEQRAAAAALCEPALLKDPAHVRRLLAILDRITASIATRTERKTPEFKAFRKGMGYCWSVAVAAFPEEGKIFFEKWLKSSDPDVRWILRENLKKNRLLKMDEAWVQACEQTTLQ